MDIKILKDSRICLNESTLSSSILEDDILFNANDGVYFKINSSGKYIVEMLKREITLIEIIKEYKKHFNLSDDAAFEDVYEFIDLLTKKDLINIV